MVKGLSGFVLIGGIGRKGVGWGIHYVVVQEDQDRDFR